MKMNKETLTKILNTRSAQINIERMKQAALSSGSAADTITLDVAPDDRRNHGEEITGTVGFRFEVRRPGLPGPLGWITALIDVDDIANDGAAFELGEFRSYV